MLSVLRADEIFRGPHVIYQTNLSTSYAAGRLAQLREAGFKLWIYKHSDAVAHPRPQHLAWNGLTLPADSPFWRTHYPPNGWGCRCRVIGAAGPVTAELMGGRPGYTEPPAGWNTLDPKTGAPDGIDKGFGYQPGNTVIDAVWAMARKTVAWPYELAKAYMVSVPQASRDALAQAIRSQPETGEAVRRYAERALGLRNAAPIEGSMDAQPYQTMGLLTSAQAAEIATLTGIDAVRAQLYDWAIGRYSPRHIRNEHGDAATEIARGQRVPTADDYARIAQVIDAPDRVWSDDGKTVLMEKRFDGQDGASERVVLVWDAQKKRRMMALTSMRIYRQPPRAQRP